jgi:hypothetical protein
MDGEWCGRWMAVMWGRGIREKDTTKDLCYIIAFVNDGDLVVPFREEVVRLVACA